MVPAESILNLESKPLFLTALVKTPSAAGLLQMLPRHTKRIEKGLVCVSVDGPEAIDEDANTTGEEGMVGLWRDRVGLGVWKDGRGGRGGNDGRFRERKRGRWQNGKLGWVATLLYKAIMLPVFRPPEIPSFIWIIGYETMGFLFFVFCFFFYFKKK